MRILHVNNQASVGYMLSRAQRELGHESDLLAQMNPKQRAPDHVGNGEWGIFFKILGLAKKYDIIHIHGGVGISGLGMLPLKLAGKRFFLHYHGSELRENIQTSFHSIGEKLFISTPDLKRYSGNVGGRELIHIPNPVYVNGVERIDRSGSNLKEKYLRIAHMPSRRKVKGTDNVIRAVDEAKKMGARIELDIIEDLPVEEAMKRLDEADICIDWMSDDYDIHGVVSTESMLRGIPTICNIDRSLYPENIPILDCKPSGLVDKLIYIDSSRDRLRDIGERTREYVLKYHDPIRVARMLEEYI